MPPSALVAPMVIDKRANPVLFDRLAFPDLMTIEGDKLKAESPTFPINRTEWGVNFRAGFLGTTKDKLINDNVLLSITLETKKG